MSSAAERQRAYMARLRAGGGLLTGPEWRLVAMVLAAWLQANRATAKPALLARAERIRAKLAELDRGPA